MKVLRINKNYISGTGHILCIACTVTNQEKVKRALYVGIEMVGMYLNG